MYRLLAIVLTVLVAVAAPLCAYEIKVQKGPRDGFFAITFEENEFSGTSLSELAVQAIGSATFGLCGTTSRQQTYSNTAQERACFANLRVLQGAIEMYNMDNPQMLRAFDGSTMQKLIKGGYLRQEPAKPHQQCEYSS